jgi:hypothetical protein
MNLSIDILDLLGTCEDYPNCECGQPDAADPGFTLRDALEHAERLAIHAAATGAKYGVYATPEIGFDSSDALLDGIDVAVNYFAERGIDFEFDEAGSLWLEWHGGPLDGQRHYSKATLRWNHTTRNGNEYQPMIRLTVG